MNNWQTHSVNFLPAEGLEANETSVRVLDHDASDDERVAKAEERADILHGNNDVENAMEREKLTAEVKRDPGYKFLMMVAAFSSKRVGRLISVPDISAGENITANVCPHADDNDQWMHSPEISGVVHLSASVYGHIKEAETIVRNGFTRVPLKMLVEDARFSTLFARLVSIRMSLSSCLSSSVYRLDRTFERLHQEQTMVLKALRNASRSVKQHDWTRPVGSDTRLGLCVK